MKEFIKEVLPFAIDSALCVLIIIALLGSVKFSIESPWIPGALTCFFAGAGVGQVIIIIQPGQRLISWINSITQKRNK